MRYVLAPCIVALWMSVAMAACPAPSGTTYTAVDASAAEVQDCVDDAEAASGGTILLPVGVATYTTTGVSKTITKSITIQGAGAARTVIVNNRGSAYEADSCIGIGNPIACCTGEGVGTCNYPAWQFSVSTGGSMIIDGVGFVLDTGHNTDGVLDLTGVSDSKVIKNFAFNLSPSTTGRAMYLVGGGLITNGTFTSGGSTLTQGIAFRSNASATTGYWEDNASWGGVTGRAFVENCTFNYGGDAYVAWDAYTGAKIVFRYNNVIGTAITWHGNDSSNAAHSGEIYNNAFTDPSNVVSFGINLRSGTAVIYNNTFDANFPATYTLSHYRSCDAGGYNPDSICEGSTGTRDENQDGTGYRCYQQPGATGATGIVQWPVIEWGNTHDGVANSGSFALNPAFLGASCVAYGDGADLYDMADHVKEERDFLNHDTCADSVDNDGNLVTDMNDPTCGAFWDSTRGRALHYAQYTCPHPLAGAGVCDATVAGTSGYHLGIPGVSASTGVVFSGVLK